MEFEPVKLNNLYNIPGSRKVGKRVGRGIGSGKGKTSGRGVKGQKARAGVAIKGFEGGQMPIIARLPKRGFNPLKRFKYEIINLEVINYLIETQLIKEGQTINKEFLYQHNLIRKLNAAVKLLGNDKLPIKVNFELDAYSKAAKESVEEAKGEVK